MFTTLLIYSLVNFKEFTFYSALSLILGVLGTVIFWYETIRVWRQKP
jgi:uncharacterized membrane protein (DUF373 family)